MVLGSQARRQVRGGGRDLINLEMAADYLRRALSCLKEAEMALSSGDPALCVRRSQESVELAVKALLRAVAVEYPRKHDVSDALLEFADKMPEPIRREINDIAALVSELAAVRGPAMYGYEREGIPASRAFSRAYAEEVLSRVTRVVRLVEENLVPKLREAGYWTD